MDLVGVLEEADLAVLVSAIAHLTGDASCLTRHDADAFFRLRNPTRMDDETTTAAIVAAADLEVTP